MKKSKEYPSGLNGKRAVARRLKQLAKKKKVRA